jgi:hypothetical protein
MDMLKKLTLIAFFMSAIVTNATAGIDEGIKAFYSKDYKAAIRELKPIADANQDEQAQVPQHMLATIYHYQNNNKQSCKYAQMAMENFSPYGALFVAADYEDGYCHTKSAVKAYALYRIAIALSNFRKPAEDWNGFRGHVNQQISGVKSQLSENDVKKVDESLVMLAAELATDKKAFYKRLKQF